MQGLPDGRFRPTSQIRDVTNLATKAIPPLGVIDYLRCTNFDFSAVPDGATIDGIIVRINRKASLANVLVDSDLKLWNGSTVIGSERADGATYYPTSLTDADHGGVVDKWGATLTAALSKSSTLAFN